MIDGFSGKEHQLYVNGQQVTDKGTRSYLDAEIKEVDIRPFVQPGRNVIAVRLVVRRRTDGILDLLKILGRFSLEKAGGTYRIGAPRGILKVGDWTKQGFPHFSGTGIYRTEIDVPARYADGRLFLDVDCGEDVLEVSVNGSAGRIAPWHPSRVEITDLVKEGSNRIELRVTNTLINILEAVEKPSGLLRQPQLVHEHVFELGKK
jgi:hypothetical protein